MAEFLHDLNIHGAGQIQFKTTAGANAGKIDQNGNDLVLSNAVGDIIIGNGSDDVYIGDGTNAVDIRFEQNMAIYADSSSTRTLTLGGANTNLILESPTITGTMTLGATTINNKLTFTSANGYILFDYEPSTGDNAEYSSEVPLLKVDHNGTEKTILSRLTNNAALAIGNDDTVAIVAGDTKSVIKDNHNYTAENVILSSEGGFIAYAFPDNTVTWANRNVFEFRGYSNTAANNGLYIGDGGQTQFIDLSRNLKNIGTINSGAITSTGKIQGTELEGTSLDINGNADIAGELQVTTNGTATLILRGDNNNSGDTGQLDSTIKMLHDDGTHGVLMETKNYAGKQSFEIKSLSAGTESSRFLIHQDNYITTSGDILPQTDNSKDLGSSSYRWQNVVAVNLHGDGSNITNVPAPSNMVTTDTSQTISGSKNFTNVGNQFNGHIYFNAYDANGNHYPHFRDGSNSNGANINIRQYYGSANYKTHVMSSDSSGNMQFDFQGTLKGDALTIDGNVDINGNADISGNLTGVDHITASGTVTANQINLDSIGDYITFYGGGETNHSITSRQLDGGTGDDIRVNTYGSFIVNLDSNDNQTSAANSSFFVGRHGGNASAIGASDLLFQIDGATGHALPGVDATQNLGNGSFRWGALELKSGGQIQWQNGDARIIEGLVNNYSLSFQTYDGSSLSTALRLDGNNNATFAGEVTTGGVMNVVGGDLKLDLGRNIRFGGQLGIIKESNGELKFYGGTNSTDGGFEFFTWDGSAYNSSLTLKNNNNATFIGDVTVPNLTVTGNLTITGDIDSYNVNNLDVVDKLITVGKGQTEANSNGSGILVDGSNASLLWDETNNTWDFNKSLDVVGNIHASGNITVGGTVDGVDIATRDALMVTTSGAQTISGAKTFSSDITMSNNKDIIFSSGSITSDSTTFAFDGGNGKEVLISSARDVRVVIDDNDDDTNNTFEIHKHSFASGNELLTLDQDGDLVITGTISAGGKVSGGEIEGTSLDINGAANIDGLLDVNTGATNTVAIFESTDDKAFIKIKDDDTDTHLISRDGHFSIGDSSSDYNNFKVNITNGNVTVAGTVTANGTTLTGDQDLSAYITQTNADARYVLETGGSSSAMTGDLHIIAGSPKLILQDNTDDDDHQIVFRNNANGDDYKITTQDFTDAGLGDGLFIGSEGGDQLALVTNDDVALRIDTIGQVRTLGKTSIGADITPTEVLTVFDIQDSTSYSGISIKQYNDPYDSNGFFGMLNCVGGSFNMVAKSTGTIKFMQGQSSATNMEISGSGNIKFNNYGAGTLVTDANGNITASTAFPTFSTVGTAFAQLGDVSVASYIRVNADETLAYLNASQFLTAIGGVDGSAYLPLAGGTMTGDVQFNGDNYHLMWDKSANRLEFWDNAKLSFGDPGGTPDLEIYHNGTDSYIDDKGTGDLRIRSNFLKIEKYTGETMATFNDDNAVTLFYNNSGKFATTSTGVSVTGTIADRDIPCLFNSNFQDLSGTTRRFISFNSTTINAASSPSVVNYLVMPYAGKVKKVYFKRVAGSSGTGFNITMYIYKNGANVANSGAIAWPSSHQAAWSPTSSNTFAAGDTIAIAFQKTTSGVTLGHISVGLAVELTDYDI